MTNPHHAPTTLDDLAAMITQGFTATQKHMDQGLGKMDERLEKKIGLAH
jgi:hypothetical protein